MLEDKSPVGELVHLYVDGAFGRRELIERVMKVTGSLAAAMVALGGYEEMHAQATPVPPGTNVAENDPDIDARDVSFPGLGGTMYGYLVSSRKAVGPQPGILVLHENRGLVEHIRDVTRRVAKAGYTALGVDLLSRQGGTSQFTDAAAQSAAYNRTNVNDRRADIIASLDYLKRQEPIVIHDRIGVVGFCAGGGAVWDLIVNVSEIAAAVPFYGTPIPATAEEIARIQTPILANYAETDRNLTRNMQVSAGLLSTANKRYGLTVYEGVGHAFHNDTGAAYNAVAAADAWARTLAHFNKFLRAPR